MKRIFGTDGARGIANLEITCELAMNIGRALAIWKSQKSENKNKLKILIGKDTRISSDMLENALVSGLCSAGANAFILGVIPTPAVAYLIKKYNADAGIMISASHNPYEFNGIKIFDKDGYKLSDESEIEIENIIFNKFNNLKFVINNKIGQVFHKNNSVIDYVNYVKSTVNNNYNYKNLKIAIDCSNGSASSTAKALFEKFNIKFHLIFDKPNGININENCGSTHLESLSKFVIEKKLDIGFAFDGDADRCLIVDENGQIVDGDQIMAICVKHLKEKNQLTKNTVVGTLMTNMGFTDFCKSQNIKFEETNVGDKYVLEKILENGYNFGGEQSGHIIFNDFSTTGDGQLTAVQILNILNEKNQKISELKNVFEKYPQTIINLKITDKIKDIDGTIKKLNEISKQELKSGGRVIVRKSGTEPLIRVMVESKNENEINEIKKKLTDFFNL